ncbi:sodium-dependent transporter [Pelagibaculum spongiae]|uniref:Transporter n=1 Tax=Pelagibaculum spongiae TaxID=2080658 RepID=A0A2V1GRD2_9GAMM|nr:sodium-dependent transporter [Pelagibaculum spongiae]PVZ66792.1 sodium-dependent transporter [Pelagibaculum spongiae]
MSSANQVVAKTWATRWTFILAATGSAVGLGNIWKFPYMTGANGGGAFVLTYLICIALVGIPIMVAETTLGRHGRHSPIVSMLRLAKENKASRAWGLIGVVGVLTGFLILSFYSVIAGWSLSYTIDAATGVFPSLQGEAAGEHFGALIGDWKKLTIFHTGIMVVTGYIIAKGIHDGLEKSVRFLMPALFILLLALLAYSAFTTGYFLEGLKFLFTVDFDKITSEAILAGMGHAFFTLSLGMGAIMAYGAYMPEDANIGSTVVTVAILDTLVALVAGMALFPIVFANGMEPSAGPGLMFISLPAAFGQIAGGEIFGFLFFLLVAMAALSSTISLVEPAVSWMIERFDVSRPVATFIFCFAVWLLGMATVFSFNIWSDVMIFGNNILDALDKLTANILLPGGGMAIALFAGWVMKREVIRQELSHMSDTQFNGWLWLVRIVSPAAVFAIFLNSILG